MCAELFDIVNVSRYYSTGGFKLLGGRNLIKAVDSVTLSVQKNEILGIIGESGSGKSTLGYLIAGLEPTSGGQILYQGMDLTRAGRGRRREFRKDVQLVFQDSGSALNPRYRIGKVLGDSLRLRGVARSERQGVVEELLVQVGLGNEYLERYPHQLSGGQRQRVNIARALAMDPRVIIADEPVSALDVSLQGQIINLLIALRMQRDLTVILISHDIAVINHACDRVAVMYQGRLVESGYTSDVIKEPDNAYTKSLIAAVPKGLGGRKDMK